jgi:hypothetical protein
MYDPARDIFTESQPSSSPPIESYDLSALDTLAGLAAKAEIAEVKQERVVHSKEDVGETAQNDGKENGMVEHVQTEVPRFDIPNSVIPDGGVQVARTKEPELSLKVTLHLRKDEKKPRQEDIQVSEMREMNDANTNQEKLQDDSEGLPRSPMKDSSPTEATQLQSLTFETREASPKKDDKTMQEDARVEKGDHSYPIPLSLSRLAKIPKRKMEDRHDKPDREQNRSRESEGDRQLRRPSRSPPHPSRSPSYHTRSPARRPSDDRYRPSAHPLIDSYRPSRDRDDHYSPPKRPRSPSPPRQLKRPVRRDITAADRERERRERQLRDAERQKADLEAARSRPVYEAVRQHYNEREERGRGARQESRIFRLRKFNNWIKSVLIAKFLPDQTEEEIDEDRGLFVLDIGCGKGGDLGKWQKQPTVQAYVGVDIAEVSVMHAEQRAAGLRGRRFSTRFFSMDCFVVLFLLRLL